MTGSKRMLEFVAMLNSEIANDDEMIIIDVSEIGAAKNKKIAISELDLRYVKNASEFDSLFDAALSSKDTDDLNEGSTNLYYATSLFNTDFNSKTTNDLTENTNLYYTEDRVDNNSNVSANTSKRHDALTLHADAVTGGLSLSVQELTNARSSDSQNGYLHQDDFDIFNKKSAKNLTDIDVQQNFLNVANDVSAVDITNFAFNTANTRAFEALVTVYIKGVDATERFGVHKLTGINKNGTWTINDIPNALNDDHGLSFSIDNSGNVEYTTPDYDDVGGGYYFQGLDNGKIRFRAITIDFN